MSMTTNKNINPIMTVMCAVIQVQTNELICFVESF